MSKEKPGILRKIVKGVLIGGGSVLSLLAPAVGGAMVSVGQQIGSGAVAAGGLIKGNVPTVDKVASKVTTVLERRGLLEPAPPVRTTSGAGTAFVLTPPLMIAGAALLLLLLFSFVKRR